jgi:pimeloyl-ACP methyl ester carboxylesterase
MTWTAKAATIGTRRFTFLESGELTSPHVIVLVHAFPVGMRMWEQLAVPAGWRALAPALPGFDGADPPPPDSTRIDDYARAVLDFLDHLRIDTAVLGGLSMGGYVSFALWTMARLRWRALMLADTRPGADSDAARAGRESMLAVLRGRGARGVADEMLPKLLGRTTRAERPQVVDHVRRLIERQTDEAIGAAIVRLRDRPDSTSLLDSVAVPALVLVGEEDEVTPPAEAEQMRDALADRRLVRIPAAGHLSCLENPGAFNAALDEFLTRIRA